MNLRFATDSDLPDLIALVNRAFQVEQFFLIGDRLDSQRARQHFEQGRFLLLDDAGLAGCVYVESRGERAYLGLLSVDPARQNRGLGRQLISAAERFARDSGARFMDLTVVNLRTELPPFYQHLGYAVAGTQPLHPDLAARVRLPCHLIRMSKALRPADGRCP